MQKRNIKLIKNYETQIVGEWKVVGGEVFGDDNEKRIKWLIKHHLKKVAGGGWETLFLDPTDGRYWELTFPQGEMHGGGPRLLLFMSSDEASKKYETNIKSDA